MKAYLALLVLAFAAYSHAADKNYNEQCTSSDKCLGDTTCTKTYSKCTNGVCRCKSGKYRKSGNTCASAKKFDESCSSAAECYTGVCTSSKCACPTGRTPSSDKKSCGGYVGNACTTANVATNCGVYMECKSSACACLAGYKEDNKMCRKYYPDESCTSGTTNCQAGTTCTSSVCKCDGTDMVAYLTSLCAHKSATKDLKEGDACDGSFTSATGKLCGKSMSCTTCPGETNKICIKNSGASMKAGLVTAALAVFMALFRC